MNKIDVVPNLAFILPLRDLRETPDVHFHDLPMELVKEVSEIDRVEHEVGAFSPIARHMPNLRPWYMHPYQEDNLLLLSGKRNIELYTKAHGSIETFEVTPRFIRHNDKMVFEGPAILGWGSGVFHRVVSPNGSISMNFARQFSGYDSKTNFHIYDLNEASGEYVVLRSGIDDQPLQDVGE